MKTTSVLVSMLFGFAVAAPMNRRALQTYTSTVIQTEIVYTTVYDGELPESTSAAELPASSSSAAAFFEESTNAPVVAPTSAPAPVPTTVKTSAVPVPTTSSSIVVPTTSSETPKPSSSSSSSSAAPTTTAAPVVPTTTQAPATTAAPAPTTSSVAPAQPTTTAVAQEAPSSGGSGEVHSGGSMTLNYFNGGLGSCGKPIADTDMTVALASDLYGASTYDAATGNPTNQWCGKSVAITYKGKTTIAKIMDKCPGCTNGGFDMTPAVWEAVTGTSVGDRITGMTWTTV